MRERWCVHKGETGFMRKDNVKVVKKDGTKESFNVQKVVVAVNKSAYRALIKFTSAGSWRRKWMIWTLRKCPYHRCTMWWREPLRR